MNILKILSLLVLILSCSGGGGGGGAAPTSPALTGAVQLTSKDLTDLDKIADVLEEEQTFQYQEQIIESLDVQPLAKISDQILNQNGETEVIVVSEDQAKNTTQIVVATLENELIQQQSITHEGKYHRLMANDDEFYFVTQNPLNLLVINRLSWEKKSYNLFGSSDIEEKNKRLNSLRLDENRLCGIHANSGTNIFSYQQDKIWYASYTDKITSLICLGDKVIVNSENEKYSVIQSDGEKFSFNKDELKCTLIQVYAQDSKLYVNCSLKDQKNRMQNIGYEYNNLQLIEAKIPKKIDGKKSEWMSRIDTVTNDTNAQTAKLHFKKTDEESWQEIKIPVKVKNKNILGFAINDGELNILTYFAVLKMSEKKLEKIPLAKTPVALNQNLIANANTSVLELDNKLQSNDYLQQLLYGEKSKERVNPAPFYRAKDKVKAFMVAKNSADTFVYKKGKSQTIRKITAEDVSEEVTLPSGQSVRDLIKWNDFYYAIILSPEKEVHVIKYGHSFDEINRQVLSVTGKVNAKLNVFELGPVVITSSNIIQFDHELNLRWQQKNIAPYSEKIQALNTGDYLTIYAGKLAKINSKSGKIDTHHKLDLMQYKVVKDLIVHEKDLYLGFRKNHLVKMALPYSLINWK